MLKVVRPRAAPGAKSDIYDCLVQLVKVAACKKQWYILSDWNFFTLCQAWLALRLVTNDQLDESYHTLMPVSNWLASCEE